MQIIEMITRAESTETGTHDKLFLTVKVGDTEYCYPLNEWVRLADEINEEAEAHLVTKCRAEHDKLRQMKLGPKYCPMCGELL